MRLPESSEQELTLLELLDRALDKGVVLWGDITLSVADIDLVYVGLKVLLASVDRTEEMKAAALQRALLAGDAGGP